MKDGKEFRQHVDAVRGTAENPMDVQEIVAKAQDLIGPVFGAGRSKELIRTILGLERVGDITALRPLLQVF